jgi:inhibitor of cysteine peptidase
MEREKEILNKIHEKGKELDIPSGLAPEWMQETLKEHERKQYFRKGRLYPALAAAASFCLIAGLLLHVASLGFLSANNYEAELSILPQGELMNPLNQQGKTAPSKSLEEEKELLTFPEMTYEEIYARLSENWQSEQEILSYAARKDAAYDTAGLSAVSESEQKQATTEAAADEAAFGQTNIQTAGVDEADRIKNDGRYLYQIARKQTKKEDGTPDGEKQGIQILDTKDGLKETAFLEGFEDLKEFYLWKNFIITIENKTYDTVDPAFAAKKEYAEDLAVCGIEPLRSYHEITIYDITDKTSPRKQKTFTLRGTSESTRISEGYFYGISSFTANPGEGEADYDAYIPTIDGNKISADKIYCPDYADGSSFLVLVSIDLSNPTEFADTRAVLSGSGTCYVSRKNIYVTHYQSVYEEEPHQEGTVLDSTKLLRFSYLKGRFYAQAEGEIPGRVDNSFSLDEYQGDLRIAATVQEYGAKKITDDRTGELLGYDYGESKETNALYILGRALNIKGKIEGLAEGEHIKSARFLGDTGYIVTFRQTDPLFALDLSDPQNPKVLGELKISGFSEYLHFYGENLLLGIGMEVDEETGREEGMKLSMFDITDPADPKEQSKLNLKDYNYSEALWDHRAVLIDTAENLIGFEADGSSRGSFWKDYLVYSYENGAFTQKLKLKTQTDSESWNRTRGTFIGETFYILRENGTVSSYNRSTGALLEELK